ncbi:hypothetical protein [Pseudomonas chlororaphis]
MTNKTEPQADVFDMSRSVPVPGPAPEIDEPERVKSKPKQARNLAAPISLEKVKKYATPVGLVIVLGVGALWSFMPDVFSFGGASPAATRGMSQPSFSPVDAMRNSEQPIKREAQIDAPQPTASFVRVPAAVVADVSAAAIAPGSEPASSAPVSVIPPQGVSITEKELQDRVVTLEQSMADLQAKIALLEARPIPVANAGASNAKVAKPTPAKKDGHKVQKSKAPDTSPDTSNLTKVAGKSVNKALVNKGFSLNTIYAGQAWIQDSEQVYVVQVGDHVGDMQIQSIDPKGRQVLTTKGVIR